jgi:hypothetical protein
MHTLLFPSSPCDLKVFGSTAIALWQGESLYLGRERNGAIEDLLESSSLALYVERSVRSEGLRFFVGRASKAANQHWILRPGCDIA